jgi:hypothetical protein
MQRLVFGEYDAKTSTRAEAFLDACRRAGIDAEISVDIRRTLWEKFVFLVGLSGTTTCIRKPIGPIRSNPRTRALLHDAMREVVAVGRVQGVLLAEDFADNRLAFSDGLPATMTSSMHNDLERGNRLEVAGLSGDVVERGNAVGVPTPVNRAIYDLLVLHALGKDPSDVRPILMYGAAARRVLVLPADYCRYWRIASRRNAICFSKRVQAAHTERWRRSTSRCQAVSGASSRLDTRRDASLQEMMWPTALRNMAMEEGLRVRCERTSSARGIAATPFGRDTG